MKLTVFIVTLGIALVFITLPAAHAAPIVDVNFPCPGDPSAMNLGENCPAPGQTDIAAYIIRLYQFAVGIAGIAAVGLIVAGAILIMVNRESIDKQSEGRSMITSAVWGLALLFGSYLILQTVNPELVTLDVPSGPQVTIAPATGPGGKLTSNDCGEFSKIGVWDGRNSVYTNNLTAPGIPGSSGVASCAVRQVESRLSVNTYDDDKYYDDAESAAAGSKVWLYAYFPKNGTTTPGKPDGARCLIYAVKRPGDKEEAEMIDLDSNLQLCEPKGQALSAAPAKCPNCSAVPISIPSKQASSDYAIPSNRVACRADTCQLNTQLIDKLSKLRSFSLNPSQPGAGLMRDRGILWQITEAWPPTVSHLDSCHQDGTCADIALTTAVNCDDVDDLVFLAEKAGFSKVVNEYATCGGRTYETTTGGSLHLEL